MSSHERSDAGSGHLPRREASNGEIAHLIGEVFESAPGTERARLLEHLLRPLGPLALVAIANGVFAKLLFQNPGADLHVKLEDAHRFRVTDVVALADFAQQVSIEAVDGLAQLLAAWPVMGGSAAAALLITVLVRRSRSRRTGNDYFTDPAHPETTPDPSGNFHLGGPLTPGGASGGRS